MTDYVISDNWLLELVSMHVSDARKREIRDTVFNKYPLSDVREHLMRDVIEEIIPTHKQQTRTLDDGWKVEVKWLIEIKKHLSPEYESMDLEDIEGVLFALVKSLRGEP